MNMLRHQSLVRAGRLLVFIAGTLLSAGCRSKAVTVEISNKTGQATSNLRLEFGGGGCEVWQVDAGGSFRCTVEPTRESDVAVTYATSGGAMTTRRLDVYVSEGVSSRIWWIAGAAALQRQWRTTLRMTTCGWVAGRWSWCAAS
jgi:hypothetical protein